MSMYAAQLYLSFSLPFHGFFPTQILAFVVLDLSYLLFHATFDRGVKVRLFARHNAGLAHTLFNTGMYET
jgi:hypothetical protein